MFINTEYIVTLLNGITNKIEKLRSYVDQKIEKLRSYVDQKIIISIPEQVQADWNQNDETAIDYVKNRTHWKEDVHSVLYSFDGEFKYQNEDTAAFMKSRPNFSLDLASGNTYFVSYDGVEYSCVGIQMNNGVGLGNLSLQNLISDKPECYQSSVEYEDTGEPFAVIDSQYYVPQLHCIISSDGKHSVSVLEPDIEIHRIGEEYLPDTVLKMDSSCEASGEYSRAEGYNTQASGKYSHAEGSGSHASGESSHAEGSASATGLNSHAEGTAITRTSASYSHAEGKQSEALGQASHAEGNITKASGQASHAEGKSTKATGENSHAEGSSTTASGYCSHAEGSSTTASVDSSHAEGSSTTASGSCSHAEGNGTKASGYDSHSEGYSTEASGDRSHAEGYNTKASGENSHAEGYHANATGINSHAEGYGTTASGNCSHAEGNGTQTQTKSQHVQGEYNILDRSSSTTARGKYAHIVGNGTSDAARSNAHTLDWDGNAWYAGTIEGVAVIVKSSTEGSSKRFKITVDDSGTISATEVSS